MNAPVRKPSTSTGLRMGGLNTTTPSVGDMVETRLVTILPRVTVEDISKSAQCVFEEMVFRTWLIDATECRGIAHDAVSVLGTLVARIKELGCHDIVLVTPRNPPSEQTEDLAIVLRSIVLRLRIHLVSCEKREAADALLTERRWQKLKGAQ
ncbi:MAG: hypothetical protein ABIO72_02900 [Patescibacteria group bacterium]